MMNAERGTWNAEHAWKRREPNDPALLFRLRRSEFRVGVEEVR
jgi:hypothetical protein